MKWFKGSDGAADKKSLRLFAIIGAALTLIVFLMCFNNLFGTYLYDYHHLHGVAVLNVISVVCFIVSIVTAIAAGWLQANGWTGQQVFIVYLVSMILGLMCSAAFDFNLHGIEKDSMNQYNPNAAPAQ
jgi:hypothetical protein